jgi:phosphatidylserine/phosphatidylglycerophosphate/cardiolipin synthase-like enzyme
MAVVKGRVLDTAGNPQQNVWAELWQDHQFYGGRRINRARTGADGRFSDTYSPPNGHLQYGAVHIRLRNDFGRILARSANFSLGPNDVTLGDFVLAPSTFSGFRITEFNPSGAFPRFSVGNTVTFFVDDHLAWAQLAAAIQAVTTELNVQLFYHDVGKGFLQFNPDPPDPDHPKPTTGIRLEDELVKVRKRNVTLRYLIRDVTSPIGATSYPIDTADKVVDFFNAALPNDPVVRRFPVDARGPMHAKFMTFDGKEAHLIGSPFQQDYFDQAPNAPGDPTHKIEDPRRGTGAGAIKPTDNPAAGTIGAPIHDVGMSIKGPAAAHMRDTFFRHWNQPGEQTPPFAVPPPVPDGAAVQIIRTLPGDRFPDQPFGEVGILEAYLRCFAEARTFIYLENQYYTQDAITDGLIQALKGTPGLQVIMLINLRLDIPRYSVWQQQQVKRLHASLNAEQNSRLGLFTIWSHEKDATKPRILKNYVHSKIAVADDKWATVGSANLDGASLLEGEYLFTEGGRDTEVNAMVLNGVEGLPASDFPAGLRKKLWSEHLGLAQDALVAPPAGGWLSVWQDCATTKIVNLNKQPNQPVLCRILPWQPQEDPTKYLQACGVKTDALNVMNHARGFDFATGKWLA